MTEQKFILFEYKNGNYKAKLDWTITEIDVAYKQLTVKAPVADFSVTTSIDKILGRFYLMRWLGYGIQNTYNTNNMSLELDAPLTPTDLVFNLAVDKPFVTVMLSWDNQNSLYQGFVR